MHKILATYIHVAMLEIGPRTLLDHLTDSQEVPGPFDYILTAVTALDTASMGVTPPDVCTCRIPPFAFVRASLMLLTSVAGSLAYIVPV